MEFLIVQNGKQIPAYKNKKVHFVVLPGGKLKKEKKRKKLIKYIKYILVFIFFMAILFIIFSLYINLIME
ncbi:MAG: hypothetical protein KatS3mg129_2667 [Leptospiraceae bacterium]|nr:MAG: hypothetical protein KatS3mg129_2667 [Leptospiraceae bacterium]